MGKNENENEIVVSGLDITLKIKTTHFKENGVNCIEFWKANKLITKIDYVDYPDLVMAYELYVDVLLNSTNSDLFLEFVGEMTNPNPNV
jgi:hypothetical protein